MSESCPGPFVAMPALPPLRGGQFEGDAEAQPRAPEDSRPRLSADRGFQPSAFPLQIKAVGPGEPLLRPAQQSDTADRRLAAAAAARSCARQGVAGIGIPISRTSIRAAAGLATRRSVCVRSVPSPFVPFFWLSALAVAASASLSACQKYRPTRAIPAKAVKDRVKA